MGNCDYLLSQPATTQHAAAGSLCCICAPHAMPVRHWDGLSKLESTLHSSAAVTHAHTVSCCVSLYNCCLLLLLSAAAGAFKALHIVDWAGEWVSLRA